MADKMENINIVGYENDDNCEHCGRKLVHCVRTSDGKLVGATCFAKVITKPRDYFGKKYRLSSDEIIRLAKIAQFWSVDKQMRNGYYSNNFQFEKA